MLDRSDESPTDLLYRAAVGPISADYYLPLFARFERTGRAGLSWNWAACLYTLNWMAFRSLWVAALAHIGVMILVPLVVFGIGRLVLQLSDTAEMMLLVAWGVLSFVVPGVVGNTVLRSELRKRMTRAITDSKTLQEACAILAAQASSRQRLIGLGVTNLILTGGALGFYLAVPEDGVLARVSVEKAPTRVVESGQVVDLTAKPSPGAASASMPAAVPASQPASASVAQTAPESTAAPVEPASTPQVALPVAPAAPPPVALAPQPLPLPAAAAKPASPASMSAPAAASVSARVAKPYFINVGLFAQEANARKAYATLQDAGLSPSSQALETAKGKRIRLRAGPFDTRAEADAAAEKIRALKLEALVFQP